MITAFKSRAEFELISKVEPIVESLGYSLRDVEILGSAVSPLIRVALDKASGDASQIGIEDCSKVHELLGPMFDVWDPVTGQYTLEVSSAGEQPSLRTWKHFEEALGGSIEFQTLEPTPMPAPMKPRKNWAGTLAALHAERQSLELTDGHGSFEVPLAQIKNAVWKRDWLAKAPRPQKEKQSHKQHSKKEMPNRSQR